MQEPPTPTLVRTPARGSDPTRRPPRPPRRRPPKPRLKKLRLGFILAGLSILAIVSTVFGMLMAVASDLPALETQAEFEKAENSRLLGDTPECRKSADEKDCAVIAKLAGNENRILVREREISPNLKNAVIAIEDRRFYEHKGVDYKVIARALWQDILRQAAAQGGSTITQQFVKNALSAQGNRSVFQKLRESALAYHLEREWSKQKILTQYLNSVYFGNGAYGVESAVRTYFGNEDGDLGVQSPIGIEAQQAQDDQRGRAASDVAPAEAALLAGMIASPTMYDPVENPRRAKERRDQVLERMLEQGFITRQEYDRAVVTGLPDEDAVDPPRPDSEQPYFSSWLTQQLVDRYRPGVVFGGGLRIRTTIDPDLQQTAEQAISRRLAGVGPNAALVAIENKTGAIKAMVGGANFEDKPFNLATNGHRQPGSAFKPFTLITALGRGVSPEATFASQRKALPVPGRRDKFVVNNYEDRYAGISSLRSATARSDNSVYAELGLKVGTRRIARVARRMGITTPLSTNPAMILGGLEQGVTPLELAYAYSTIANKGVKVSGSLAPGGEGPVAVQRVEGSGISDENQKSSERVFPEKIGETAQQLLAGVIQGGTGSAAQIGEFAAGKTGTTENYGDAWFVGFNEELTVAVWIGYPDKLQPMEVEFHGEPVTGGTWPALIWQDFMSTWVRLREAREAAEGKDDEDEETAPAPVAPQTPTVPEDEQKEPAKTEPEEPSDENERKGPGSQQAPPAREPPSDAPVLPPGGELSPGGGGGTDAPG